jgi:hypothetical protein
MPRSRAFRPDERCRCSVREQPLLPHPLAEGGHVFMNRKVAVLSAFLVILAIGCGSMNRATPSSMDDTAMKADVKGKIAEVYPKETFNIGVTVNNGVVTLTGDVNSAEQRSRIGDAAGSVNGVKSVINNIHVKS